MNSSSAHSVRLPTLDGMPTGRMALGRVTSQSA
jgi:hypothetical protein